jgi:hypothetical protein
MACCSHQLHGLKSRQKGTKITTKFNQGSGIFENLSKARVFCQRTPYFSALTSLIPKHEPSSLSLFSLSLQKPGSNTSETRTSGTQITQISQILRNLTLSEEKEDTH